MYACTLFVTQMIYAEISDNHFWRGDVSEGVLNAPEKR